MESSEFFLYDHAGPLSRYSRSVSGRDMWRGGSCVIPRSDEKQDSGAKSYATMTLIANFSENQRNKSTKEQMAVFVNLFLC